MFICARFYPDIGGVERHVREVGARLVEKKHEVSVITEKTSNPMLNESINIDGISVDRIDFGKSGIFKKFRIWTEILKRLPLFLQADVIHIHDVFFWYLPVRFLLFWKPVYATFHGYEGVVPPKSKAVFYRRLGAFLSKGTIEVGRYVQKWYGTKPDIVVYGGVSKEVLNMHIDNGRKSDTLRFACIGRLAQDIGVDSYVRFFSHLRDKKIPFTLDVYGDGPMQKKIEKYGTVHGFVKDLSTKIQKSDIVCASSYLTMIDACALGKPIIAFYENELKKDYLKEFPLKEGVIATDLIEDATIYILEKKFTSSQEIAKKARELFSWDRITNEYLTLWKK